MRPGPFTPSRRPSRNTTSRWYSGTMRIAFARNRMTSTIDDGHADERRVGEVHQVFPPRAGRAPPVGARSDSSGSTVSTSPSSLVTRILEPSGMEPLADVAFHSSAATRTTPSGSRPPAQHHALPADDGLRSLGGWEMSHRERLRDHEPEEQRHEGGHGHDRERRDLARHRRGRRGTVHRGRGPRCRPPTRSRDRAPSARSRRTRRRRRATRSRSGARAGVRTTRSRSATGSCRSCR